jgi:hypothetical protein
VTLLGKFLREIPRLGVVEVCPNLLPKSRNRLDAVASPIPCLPRERKYY